jgi:hypothetical protein
MNHKASMFILVASLSLLLCCTNANERNEVEGLALRVHEQMRAANFAAIYQESEPRFKTVGTELEFVNSLKELQEKLGSFEHAETMAYETKLDSRIGRTYQLTCELEYDHGRAREDLTVVRSAAGKMQLWALEIQPLD